MSQSSLLLVTISKRLFWTAESLCSWKPMLLGADTASLLSQSTMSLPRKSLHSRARSPLPKWMPLEMSTQRCQSRDFQLSDSSSQVKRTQWTIQVTEVLETLSSSWKRRPNLRYWLITQDISMIIMKPSQPQKSSDKYYTYYYFEVINIDLYIL